MSRQQRKDFGTQDFRKFPFVEVEPLPDINVKSYVRHALNSKNLGCRLDFPWPSKPFQCRKTGKSYVFWDNYLAHVRKLSPLYGPSTEKTLQIYQSPYDERTFHFRDNLKLHNRVKRFEESQEIQVLKRLNCDNQEFSERDIELQVKKKRINFRFLEKPEKNLKEEIDELKKIRRSQLIADAGGFLFEDQPLEESQEDEEEKDLPRFKDLLSRPSITWPLNYDDLPPIKRGKRSERPKYLGWTHSNDADSWFLESHTPSGHEEYDEFTKNLYGKKAICPRLWDTVYPDTERPAIRLIK